MAVNRSREIRKRAMKEQEGVLRNRRRVLKYIRHKGGKRQVREAEGWE